MKTYLVVYFGSAFLALLITPIVILFAQHLRIAAVPGHRHMHNKPISHIGGVAIFISMISLTIPVLFLTNDIGETFRDIFHKVIVLLSAAAFMFITGLIDDIKTNGLRARIKLLAQITAATAVCSAGITIKSVAVANWFVLDFGWFSWPLTIFWIVGITNAVNLSDGLDGLAAGIASIACGVIAIFAIHHGSVVMAVLMLALLGSLTGFLFFNFNPAKIFMGDCGSMFLGFTIASSSVLCSTKSSAIVGLSLPILALGVPILDTLFSMLRRFLERRSIFSADRSHFHHRLVDLGFNQRNAVIIIYMITLAAVILGMLTMLVHNGSSLIILFCILLLLTYVFHVVGAIRLGETIKRLQKKYTITSEIQKEIRNFEDAQLHFRKAETFHQWWQAVSKTAEIMGFLNLNLPLVNRDGSARNLNWWQNRSNSNSDDALKVNLPVRDRRSGQKLNLSIEVCSNGSLESAGRRIALFTRLMDEHDITTLPVKNKASN